MATKTRKLRVIGDKTRNSIIQTAMKLFAKQGFAGTSISQIAEKAKISRSLIFHHFTNKSDLWKAVKTSYVEQLDPDLETPAATDQGLRHFLEHIANQRFALYENNSDLVRMIAWQNLEKEGAALRGGSKLSPDYLIEGIKHFQEQGEIQPDLDPELIMVLIISAISGAFFIKLPVFNQSQKRKNYLNLVIDSLYNALSKK